VTTSSIQLCSLSLPAFNHRIHFYSLCFLLSSLLAIKSLIIPQLPPLALSSLLVPPGSCFFCAFYFECHNHMQLVCSTFCCLSPKPHLHYSPRDSPSTPKVASGSLWCFSVHKCTSLVFFPSLQAFHESLQHVTASFSATVRDSILYTCRHVCWWVSVLT